jgi:cleavage stimulation factor subunit 2
MWGNAAAPPPPPPRVGSGGPLLYGAAGGGSTNTGSTSSNQGKNDVFVGNLAFNTTEEQLQQVFSDIGRVIHVRLVTDVDTGKPRGFAFVEFSDAQAALSAIRNMNDYELNGRRIRVNFSNSSHLEALAGQLGMDLTNNNTSNASASTTSVAPPASNLPGSSRHNAATGTVTVADALKSMSKAEMYDVVAKLKEIADKDSDEARRTISGHPQLPEALLYIMSKLDMVKTPVSSTDPSLGGFPGTGGLAVPPPPPPLPVTSSRAADPRAPPQTAPVPSTTYRADPRAPADPRQAAAARVDPRQQQQQHQPSSQSQPASAPAPAAARSDPRQQSVPAPPAPPRTAAPPSHTAGLDPALVQQVMSLTPQQIAQLPPDKQASILQLRQQITGGNQ